jgi:hypothetical protein
MGRNAAHRHIELGRSSSPLFWARRIAPMSHRSLFWPLTLIAIAAVTLVLILTSASANLIAPTIAEAIECSTSTANNPYCIQTQTAAASTSTIDPQHILNGCPTDGPANNPPYPPYTQCLQTGTAIRQLTAQAGVVGTPTWTPTRTPTFDTANGANPTRTPVTSVTPTRTYVVTATPTNTQIRTTRTRVPSAAPTGTLTLQSEATPVDVTSILCVPGETIGVEGNASPRTALIVTFGGRPVGGGFSREDGSYRIWLRIGAERPGIYPVNVEERSTSEVLQTLSCEVPAFTPTPTPPQVP